jgi:hypothetical protein
MTHRIFSRMVSQDRFAMAVAAEGMGRKHMTRYSLFRVFRDNLVTKSYLLIFLVSSVLFLLTIAMLEVSIDPLRMPVWYRIPFTLLGMLGVVGCVALWLGMWSYWLRFDCSKAFVKRLWFLILVIGFSFGSVLYFFFVYIPQVTRRIKVNG